MHSVMTPTLPHAARRFIEAAIVAGDMALPFHYPPPDAWQGWQGCFRFHGITGESLISTTPGHWQPGWYVIALDGFDAPFFIDIGDEAQGFPVYHAPLGAGRWDAQRVAPTLQRFADLLAALRDLGTDDAAARRLIETEAEDLDADLWREVLAGRQDRIVSEADADPPPDPGSWQHGTLVITAIGPQKMKVAHFLKRVLDLSPQAALALTAQGDIAVARGYVAHLRRTQAQLQALGATVECRVDGPA